MWGTLSCPLCPLPHTREQIGTGELTLEHVVPTGLGELHIVLTCKRCNNSSGSALDSHLHRYLELQIKENRWNARPVLGKFLLEDGRFIPISLDDPTFDFKKARILGIRLRNVPNLPGNKVRGRMIIQTDPNRGLYNPRMCGIATIKIAYLQMFKRFGYSYICSGNLDPIREQILNPNRRVIDLDKLMVTVEFKNPDRLVHHVVSPDAMRAMLVPIDLQKNGYMHSCYVVMPSNANSLQNWSNEPRSIDDFAVRKIRNSDHYPLEFMHWNEDGDFVCKYHPLPPSGQSVP